MGGGLVRDGMGSLVHTVVIGVIAMRITVKLESLLFRRAVTIQASPHSASHPTLLLKLSRNNECIKVQNPLCHEFIPLWTDWSTASHENAHRLVKL